MSSRPFQAGQQVPSPTTKADTGWIFPGVQVWSRMDTAVWSMSSVLQLYLTIMLLARASTSCRKNKIWIVIFIALLFNLGGAIVGVIYVDCLMFNNTPGKRCDTQYRWYYRFDAFCFLLGYYLMYFRKVNLAPETVGRRGLLDLLVLFVCFGLNLAKEIPCQLQGLMACFSFDIYQTCAAAVCFCYFDVWFFVRVMRRSNEDGSRWEVVQLCFHTGLMNAMYLFGCWTYTFAINNFYTNLLWTIGFCIQPLSSIQSVTSPNFLKLFSARAGEINIPSWSEVQVHSGKHVGSTPSRDRMSLSPWDSRSPSISHTRDAPLLPIPGAMPNSKTRKCETELGNE